MEAFRKCFSVKRPVVIGMIHVQSLPGTPKCHLPFTQTVQKAVYEAETYRKCGVDSVMVENMHDVPYVIGDNNGPEITACMTTICDKVKSVFGGPVGVQILAAANRQALAIAMATGLQFIRVEGFVFSHIADEGLINGCAGDLLRYRRNIGADEIMVFTDIKKKHSSHSITCDVDITETAQAAEYFLSDGIILTGSSTGQEANAAELHNVLNRSSIPVLIGSGITKDNMMRYKASHGYIIGSHFKEKGDWRNPIDKSRVKTFMDVVENSGNPDGDTSHYMGDCRT